MSSNNESTLPTKDQYFQDLKADAALSNYQGDCPVCYDPFDQAARATCGHIVCLSCLTKCMALKNTCPMCRREQYQCALAQEEDGDDEDSIDEENGMLPILDEYYAFALDWSGANQLFDVYEDPDEHEDDVHGSADGDAGDEDDRVSDGNDALEAVRDANERSAV